MLRFGGVFVSKSDLDFGDVAIHCAPTDLLVVVPFKVNTCKLLPFPIRSNFVVFLEGSKKVLSMLASCALNSEVVNNEDKDNWSPFVPP